MDINEIAQKAHAAAIRDGHYEGKSFAEMITDVMCELAEASQASKKHHHADWKAFNGNLELFPENFQVWFNCFIKDSIEDELADAIIILLGMSARFDIEKHILEKLKYNEVRERQ